MKIKSLYIKEFAGVIDRHIDFSCGLNIVEGPNESGKSTILAFIKFMLYGLPQKRTAGAVTEKDRAFSWKNGVASGTMTLSLDRGDFRIERAVKSGTRAEELNIIDLVSGAKVHSGEVPGELFLGVPLAVFESSACVKQLACSSLDGEELGRAIENLLLSADEALNTQKAVDKLEAERKKLLHKTGKGGSISALNLERDALRARLANAQKASARVLEYEAMFKKYSEICEETRKSVAENKVISDAYEKRQQLIRIESLKRTKARIDGINEEYMSYKAEKCYLGFVPDSDYIMALSNAERDCINAINDTKRRKEEAENARGEATEKELEKAAFADAIDEMGGETSVPFDYSEMRSKRSQMLTLSLTSLALTAMFSALCVMYALGKELPGLLSGRFIFPALALSGVVFAVLAIVCFFISGKKKAQCEYLCKKIGLNGIVSKDTLLTYIGECMGARTKCESRRAEAERTRLGYEASLNRLSDVREELDTLLGKVGERLSREAEENEITGIVAKVKEKSEAICHDIEEYERDLAKYTTLYEERIREAEGIDESALGNALSEEMLQKLSAVNITNLRRETDFMRAKLDTAEQKRAYYDRELIGLHATAENPMKIELLLKETEARIAEETELHGALTLAHDVILEAADSMRRNITPMLRHRAGELLSALTNGKYGEIGISSDFKITVNADNTMRPIEAMSTGTRDAAYLAVRLALISVLYRGETPTMLFDEVLSQIDDKRACAILNMLSKYSEDGKQSILFSCHSRESGMVNANVVRL